MSPEQIDANTIDHRSDLYCLGLVFYELLAGRPPFQSGSPRQLLNLQCTTEPPPLPEEVRGGLPKGVEQLLFQLLEKAPEDRPYVAQDVIDRLEPFQTAGGPIGRGSLSNRTGPAAAAITPPRTPASPQGALPTPGSAGAERARESKGGARPSDRMESHAASQPARADTIALVDKVDRPREVPAAIAVGLIVALSALAGLGAYFIRASSPSPELPAGGPTAVIPGTPAPPLNGPGLR
jgi:serine/threonine-protein kinase